PRDSEPEHAWVFERPSLPMDSRTRFGLTLDQLVTRPSFDLLEHFRMILVAHPRTYEVLERLAFGLEALSHNVCRHFLPVILSAIGKHGNIEQIAHVIRHVVLSPERLDVSGRQCLGSHFHETFHVDKPGARVYRAPVICVMGSEVPCARTAHGEAG